MLEQNEIVCPLQPCSDRSQKRGHDAAVSRTVSIAGTPLLQYREHGPHAQTTSGDIGGARGLFALRLAEDLQDQKHARAQKFFRRSVA